MSLRRYDILDAYTLEELRREYTRADAKGRISLLKELYDQQDGNPIPFDIARLAVEDSEVEVREWIALHGAFLDYSEKIHARGNRSIERPERNLEKSLKNDLDPFVRACLRENPTVFSGRGDFYWMPYFQEATKLERLALMRNPEVWCGYELIQRIFDYENEELGLTLEERKELIGALLTNKEALAQLETWTEIGQAENFLTTVWELASKWPKSPESDVRRTVRPILMPHLVYRYVQASDKTKNNEGRMFPLTPRLREILEKQLARTEALQRATGKIIPWLFHRDGNPINSFRKTWITACIAAGFGHVIKNTKGKVVKKVADRIPHDFRRTAVRNLERAGVARSAAMKMVGHKTESIYRRYAIADESMLQEAGEKLARLHSADDTFHIGK